MVKSIFFGRNPIRQAVDAQVKVPLLALLELFQKILEVFHAEPTCENTERPNTHVLIGVRDKFFSYLRAEGVSHARAYRGLWNFAIYLYECDEPYQQWADWIVEVMAKKVMQGEWQAREKWTPNSLIWKEFVD